MIDSNSEEVWVAGVRWKCLSLRMSPDAPQQPVTALYSSTAHPHWSQIHHAATQRQTVVTTSANDVILYQPHNCQERREISPHIVAAPWPLRSPWTQHVPPWLSMSLWLALMIECFPCQTMHYSIILGMHLHSRNWFPHLSSSSRADILQLTIRS